jgi:hypothetical protein
VGKFGVKADEEVVVVEAGEGAREGRGRWQVSDMVEGRGRAECWRASARELKVVL